MFEINAGGIATETVSITDYKMVATNVARIIVAYTGKPTPEKLTDLISAKLQRLAAPVEKSFRMVKAGVLVGYVTPNPEVRIEEQKQMRANYKVVAKNILMSNEDNSLWEIKNGAAGQFLARQGQEDLSELVAASATYRADVPRVQQLSAAVAAKHEVVGFVSENGAMDYGICLAMGQSGTAMQVFSSTQMKALKIPVSAVATVLPVGNVKIPRAAHDKITAAGITREDKSQQIEYWTRLFSYAPEYRDAFIKMVDEQAVM